MAPTSNAISKADGKTSRQNPGSACQQCRQRKSRCDRSKPCTGCIDAGLVCHYGTTTPPDRGPSKGHLKAMRERIAALEQKLLQEHPPSPRATEDQLDLDINGDNNNKEHNGVNGNNDNSEKNNCIEYESWGHNTPVPAPPPPPPGASSPGSMEDSAPYTTQTLSLPDNLIPDLDNVLGLHVHFPALLPAATTTPATATINTAAPNNYLKSPLDSMSIALPPLTRADLDGLYFDRIHQFMPIIHKRRYYQRTRPASDLASHTCLQYAMWTLASALSSQFHHLRDDLYRETIHSLGNTNPVSPGEATAPHLEVAQAWILISIYEFTQVTFPRAWASAGQAIRLIQLMRLNEVDASAHTDDSRDFFESETKRRTFWIAFCLDRFICILEKLPLTLNEQTICTRLPAPEHVFQSGSPVKMPFLSQALSAGGEPSIMASPFVESILFTALWGRVFIHHQQSAAERACSNISAEAGERQTQLNDLLSRRLSQFRKNYPTATVEVDQMLLFTNMIAQTTVLSLCKEAELVSPDSAKYSDLKLRYQWRAPEAAEEISCLAEQLSGFNLFKLHPFTPIPLFCSRQLILTLGHGESLKEVLTKITDTLQELRNVNRLCQETQNVLVPDVEFSNFLQSSNGIITLYEDNNMLEATSL